MDGWVIRNTFFYSLASWMQSLFFSSSFIILSFLFLYFILNMKLSITQIKNGLEQITHSRTLTLSKMLNQQQRNERSTTNDKWKLEFFFRIKKNWIGTNGRSNINAITNHTHKKRKIRKLKIWQCQILINTRRFLSPSNRKTKNFPISTKKNEFWLNWCSASHFNIFDCENVMCCMPKTNEEKKKLQYSLFFWTHPNHLLIKFFSHIFCHASVQKIVFVVCTDKSAVIRW